MSCYNITINPSLAVGFTLYLHNCFLKLSSVDKLDIVYIIYFHNHCMKCASFFEVKNKKIFPIPCKREPNSELLDRFLHSYDDLEAAFVLKWKSL